MVGGQIDCLMLQEHHLSESRIRRCGSLLARHSEVFWSASFGPSGVQGGVCISIADSWRPAILERGIIVQGRAQWITLQWRQVRVGLLNIYAPNHASARAQFWDQILGALPRTEAWCVGGDFNMIEDMYDRSGGSLTTVHGAELAAWERLCLAMHIEDAWHHPSFSRRPDSLGFSRSDRRVGGMNMSRIDRVYVSGAVGDWGGTIGILAGTCFSDHFPVLLMVTEGERRGSSVIRVPASVQTDGTLADQIGQLWAQCQWWQDGDRARTCAEGLLHISSFL